MASTMAEIVYASRDEGHVMSEKVTQLASSVYSEFERMIKKYDEDVVKELMPLVVGILECLDQSYTEKQEAEVEMELLKEDNEQLLTQYEREKQLRKAADQKYLEFEDENEEYRKQTEDKMDGLESHVRQLELKNKNASDHLNRMEDKESEMKKEYNKVHERYTELMRTHMDYMERAKMLMGTDRIAEMANSPRSRGMFHLPNLKQTGSMHLSTTSKSASSPPDASAFDMMSPRSKDSNISLKSELSDLDSPDVNSNTGGGGSGRKVIVTTKTIDKEQNTDRVDVREFATATKTEEAKKELPAVNQTSLESNNDSSQSNSADSQSSDTKVLTASVDSEGKKTEAEISNKSQETSIAQTELGSGDSDKTLDTVPMVSEGTETVSEPVTEATDEKTESEQAVIKTSVTQKTDKESDKLSASADGTEMKQKKKKSITIDKRKVSESKSEPKSPDSPMSPVFDENDFSFEEDAMPGLDQTIAHIVATTPELEDMEESMESSTSTNNKPSKRNDASIYDELTIQDADLIGDVDFGADITDSDDDQEDRKSNVSDNFFGMSRELENLILENTELLATKNALNIVKDDLIAKVDELSSEQEILKEEIMSLKTGKDKLQSRIKELEDEIKKSKEELEKKSQQAQEGENEDDVPMAQRKRFTRVEMARVLMERNQYKERLMELQEAVRWTEMIRASREHPEISQSKKKSSIWNFFSNLFSSPNKPTKKPLPVAMVKYNAPTTNVQPVGDPNQKSRSKYNIGDKSKAFEFLQDDLNKSLGEPIVSQPDTSEKAKKEREKERKEQYKQVRAHVKKDDGRMQAYGWSLPAKFQPHLPTSAMGASGGKSTVPVPVPVYCRPLLEGEQGIKIWCAAGVNLTGGRTKDGGHVVGASVFYSSPAEIVRPSGDATEVDKLDQELKDHESNMKPSDRERLSPLVWICTSTHGQSCVSVIDANNPSDILETFRVSTTPVLCIASVPGALESDYPVDEDILKADSYPQFTEPEPSKGAPQEGAAGAAGDDAGIGGISLVQCAAGSTGKSPAASPPRSREGSPYRSNHKEHASDALAKQSGETSQPTVFKARGEPVPSGEASPDSSSTGITSRRLLKEPSGLVKDGINSLASGNDPQTEEVAKMSSVQPTMWLGTQSGSLYVHSSVSQWKRCLHSVKLRDSVLNIVHVKGRVLVALADGTVAIFHRDTDGQWDLEKYHLLDLGRPHHSIRCMTVIANKHVWCGYRNKIHVVDPQTMNITKSFDAHPRKESQVRQLAWVGDGVWVSIRLDSTLRLYHAYTHQHLQDVDIEPYVSKMLGTGKLGFSFVRITSMMISCTRLWIGTGNGVIISVPLSESNKMAVSMSSSITRPGGLVRVYSDNQTDSVTPASFIPYCTMAQAQLSFHGHRDAVKFFVAVPGKRQKGLSSASSFNVDKQSEEVDTPPDDDGSRLVLSGGEGYVDFRIGDGDDDALLVESGEEKEEKTSLSKGERSHLIVWEVSSPE